MSWPRTKAFCWFIVLSLLFVLPTDVGFAQESASINFSVPPAVALNPLPAEPLIRARKPAVVMIRRRENLALFLALSAGTYTAASLDMRETMARRRDDPTFQEADPLARPFTRLPTPAYYAAGFAMATGLNWLSFRMARSERWHRVWWLPQVCAIGGNLFGYAYSKKSE